jgi:hypothetical protein
MTWLILLLAGYLFLGLLMVGLCRAAKRGDQRLGRGPYASSAQGQFPPTGRPDTREPSRPKDSESEAGTGSSVALAEEDGPEGNDGRTLGLDGLSLLAVVAGLVFLAILLPHVN